MPYGHQSAQWHYRWVCVWLWERSVCLSFACFFFYIVTGILVEPPSSSLNIEWVSGFTTTGYANIWIRERVREGFWWMWNGCCKILFIERHNDFIVIPYLGKPPFKGIKLVHFEINFWYVLNIFRYIEIVFHCDFPYMFSER